MSIYINVGAYSDNQRIPTKAKLKALAKESPELLRFDQTSALGNNGMPKLINTIMLRPAIVLSVCGPDPYNNRKWYANVQLINGKLTVS
jgi:hypothetical protein